MREAHGHHWPVLPGDFRVTREVGVLTTLLGSCVAVCLFDGAHRVAGMNHFLLPVQRYSESTPLGLSTEGRYGIDAMELLINGMLKHGAERRLLRAKVFGGAALIHAVKGDAQKSIGQANITFVHEFLHTEGIPIDAEDLGGFRGRVIHFHTDTYDVWRRYIKNPTIEAQIKAEEAEALRRQQARRGSEGEVTLFE